MLAVTSYPQEYIDHCRAWLDAQLAAYAALRRAAGKSAVATFEPLFFANLTLVLDASFVHRTRAIEGKDGNPLNEVRMLCTSILRHDGLLTADKTITYRPDASVLGLSIGDPIHLDQPQFETLAAAYFAELERKFTSSP
jgi:hypothetical protein